MDKYYIIEITEGARDYNLTVFPTLKGIMEVLTEKIDAITEIEHSPTSLVSTLFSFMDLDTKTVYYLIKAGSENESTQIAFYEFNMHPYIINNTGKFCIKALTHSGKVIFIDQNTEELILPFVGYLKDKNPPRPTRDLIKEILETDIPFIKAIEELRA